MRSSIVSSSEWGLYLVRRYGPLAAGLGSVSRTHETDKSLPVDLTSEENAVIQCAQNQRLRLVVRTVGLDRAKTKEPVSEP